MEKRLLVAQGNKIASLFLGENSLLLSSQDFNSEQDFLDGWNKKLSLATKIEVKYDAIKSVKKEDDEADVLVKYKAALGIPGSVEFSLPTAGDYEFLFVFLEKERYFTKTYEKATPVKAALNYGIGLVATLLLTVFSYFEALAIANGTADRPTTSKSRLFYSLVESLGDKGVLAVGGLLACYLAYKIWTRFTNPPQQVEFFPPQA